MAGQVINNTDLLTVCGMRGTGKTTFIQGFMNRFKKTRILVFDPLDQFHGYERIVPDTQNPEELAEVCAYVFRQGNMILIVSEAELYMPNVSMLPSDTFRLLSQGRNRGTAVWADTRRIANLSKTMFNLSEHCIIFRHFGVNDLKYLGEWIPDREAIKGLPDYHFIYLHRGIWQICTPIPKSDSIPKNAKGVPTDMSVEKT